MYQLIALFRTPSNPEEFDLKYRETHLPLARMIPGVLAIDVSKTIPGKDGAAKYYQMSVLTFADKDSFKAAMRSQQNAEAGLNLQSFAGDIVEFYTAEKVPVS